MEIDGTSLLTGVRRVHSKCFAKLDFSKIEINPHLCMMNCEIITIGDELLIGQVIDTNSAWMATRLNESGLRVKQITSVSDDKQHIIEALDQAKTRADIILITGGLGPTRDDLTKDTLCEYFNSGLEVNQKVLMNQIDIASIRLNRQVENLLNMSRLETGMLKTKYDWWRAFLYVSNRTFLGFVASFFLFFVIVTGVLIGSMLLLQTLGLVALMLTGTFVSVVILTIMTYCEINHQGYRYAKY